METDDVGSLELETKQVVNDEFVKRHKQKRHPSKRSAVYHFALLVTNRFFYDVDAELCTFVVNLVFGILKISEEPFNGLSQFRAGDLLSRSD